MTVIVASLFLPFTVKFEVSATEEISNSSAAQTPRKNSAGVGQKSHPSGIVGAILPSLSSVHTAVHTPGSSTPGKRDAKLPSAEDFFDKSRKGIDSAHSLGESVNEKLSLQLVQPRSKFSNAGLTALVVEPKRKSEEGLPGMKISRASSFINLASHRSPILRSGSEFASIRSASRQLQNFSIEHRGSGSALISEDEDHSGSTSSRIRTLSLREPFAVSLVIMDYDEYEEVEKMAPYGGFSRCNLEESFLNRENIFSRAPWQIEKAEKGNGSLVNAVELAAERGTISRHRWVGAMSLPCDAVPKSVLEDIGEKLFTDYACDAVFIDDETFQGHYNSFCKQILWPTLHYQIPDYPKSKAFEEHLYNYYKKVNQMVADKLVESYVRENNHLAPEDPENMIWVHDYHLLLVPAMVRKRFPNAKIGFFLHVSFPSLEVFRCLAQRVPLLEGMLGADCITFQINEYVCHFLQTCSRLLLADSNDLGLVYNGDHTRVNTIPVGIDVPSLQRVVESADVREWQKMIRERWPNHTLLVSRDKLDKLRGVKQKLLAYEQYLRQDESRIDTTVMIQIFIGLQDDVDHETEVMEIISRTNAMQHNISSQPVVVLSHDIDFDQYVALMAEADTFIVSSMREGLNVTCHEFIVATEEKKAPLIISEFIGLLSLLSCHGKGALLVNPWDIHFFREQMENAISMSTDERKQRWNNDFDVVQTHNSISWVDSCLTSINVAWQLNQEKNSMTTKPFTDAIFRDFMHTKDKRRLFVINVDDPSIKFDRKGNKSAWSSSQVGRLLSHLLAEPQNIILFASIMSRKEMELLFTDAGKAGLMAEFGGYIKLPGMTHWISILDDNKQNEDWIPQVAQVFEAKAERLPGSRAVVSDCTVRLVAHTAIVNDRKRSSDVMGECVQYVNEAFGEEKQLHATIVDGSVVVQEKNLSIRAIHFLISYYSADINSDVLTQLLSISRVESTSSTMFRGAYELPLAQLPDGGDHLSHFFYSGGINPIDEGIYDIAHNLKRDGLVNHTLTVAVNNDNCHNVSSAVYGCTRQDELFGILGSGNEES